MGIRSAVFDEWVKQQMSDVKSSTVIHIGCGMDSRATRIGTESCKWYDVNFPEVIEERKRYYSEKPNYQMIGADVRDSKWLSNIKEKDFAIVIMEGVSMYLTADEMKKLTDSLCAHFGGIALLVDCYTALATRMSKRKNPINDVGVREVYGVDNPLEFQRGELAYVKEHAMIPQKHISRLHGFERFIFGKLYEDGFSKKLYRSYEYKKDVR